MNWKDKLRPASFRGVPFKVSSHNSDVAGRQIALHEFPSRDKPFPEDLRKKTATYTVEGYVIGRDYFSRRDALIAACNKAGPGKLVHPWLGTLDVVCDGCTISESTGEGGLASFTLSFIEAGENLYPTAQPDTGAALQTSADIAQASAILSFVEGFSVDGLPGFIRTDAADIVGLLAQDLNVQASVLGSGTVDYELQNQISSLETNALSLMDDPENLAEEISGTIGNFTTSQILTPKLVESLPGLTGFADDLPVIPTTTATRLQQITNTDAIVSLVRRTGIVQAAQSVPGVELLNRSAAIALQDSLVGEIDDELDIISATEDDLAFNAFSVLRTSVVENIKARTPYLAQVVDVSVDATVPALVQAYKIYQDPSRDEEIVQRNGLAHPGFVPGGESLEILIDGLSGGTSR